MYSESWKDRLARWIADKLPRRVVYFTVIRAWAWATTGEWAAEDAVSVLASDVVRRWEKSVRSQMDKEGAGWAEKFGEVLDQLAIRQAQARLRRCLLAIGWTGLVIYLCWVAFGG